VALVSDNNLPLNEIFPMRIDHFADLCLANMKCFLDPVEHLSFIISHNVQWDKCRTICGFLFLDATHPRTLRELAANSALYAFMASRCRVISRLYGPSVSAHGPFRSTYCAVGRHVWVPVDRTIRALSQTEQPAGMRAADSAGIINLARPRASLRRHFDFRR